MTSIQLLNNNTFFDASSSGANNYQFAYSLAKWFESKFGNNNFALSYKLLSTLVHDIGLNANDSVQMKIYLDRFITNNTTTNINTYNTLVYAFYVSQSITYDEPLTKNVWLKYTGGTWSDFIDRMLEFCSSINYDFQYDPSTYNFALATLLNELPTNNTNDTNDTNTNTNTNTNTADNTTMISTSTSTSTSTTTSTTAPIKINNSNDTSNMSMNQLTNLYM